MKHLKRILMFALVFSPLAKVVAQDENYDAVYLSLTKEYTLNADGTIDYRCTKTLKLQNYRSFHRLFGETFIVYNPDFQELKVNQAYTIMADGKKVVAPENAFNEVLPGFAAHAPAFNQLREMVVTHTGLEIGSTIFFDYQIHTAKGFFPAFMGSTRLAEDQPVKSMTVVIKTPAKQPLFFHLFNSALMPKETNENGYTIYTWTQTDIPAIEAEAFQKDPLGDYPALIFSSLQNYEPLVEYFTSQEAFQYQTNLAMDGFVGELASENQKKADLVFAIQESVVKDFNLFGVPEEDIGYKIRKPVEVWNSNGGTVAEKAVMMSALLKQAGIRADPVLIFPKNQFNVNIGNLSNLKEWAVKTEIPGFGQTYLSVKQINAFDLMILNPEGVFISLEPGKSFLLAYPPQNKDAISLKGQFVMDTVFQLSGELNGSLSGAAIPFLSLARSEDKLKSYLRGGLSSSKFSSISFPELSPEESNFSGHLTKSEALKKDSDMYYFALPYFSTGLDSWEIDQSYDFTIAIPENLTLYSGEQEVRITNEAGSFLFLVKEKENMIQVLKEINFKGNNGGAESYKALKELMDSWSLWKTNNLIFKK
ncbi:MAG: DUF3857 domain-containing protein [Bacteroidales bacterium]|nr:DUF3857 domain-containing protein [Bacteroidales bacterium]